MYAVYRYWEKHLNKILDGVRSLEEACSVARARQTETATPGMRYLVRGPTAVPGRRGNVWFEPDTTAGRHTPERTDAPTGQQDALLHSGRTRAAQRNIENETLPHKVAVPGHMSEGTNKSQSHASRPSSSVGAQAELVANELSYSVMRQLHGNSSVINTDIASLGEARRIAALAQQQEPDKLVKYFVQAPRRPEARKQREPDTARTLNTTGTPASGTHADAQRTRPPVRAEMKPTPASRRDTVPAHIVSAPSPLPKKEMPKREQQRTKLKPGVRCYVVRVQGQSRVTVQGGFDSPESARAYADVLAKQATDPSVTYEIAYSGGILQSSSSTKGGKRKINASSVLKQPYGPAAPPVHSQQRERRKHDWDVEDRDGDVSLVVREDDEAGLGIPAQWGTGRRNRKGPYIP